MRCIDFFVVSRVIAGAARAEIVHDVPLSPHYPVRLVLPRIEPVADVKFVKVPKRFPLERPIGCLGPPSRVGGSPWPRCVLIPTPLCRTNGTVSVGRRRPSGSMSFRYRESLLMGTSVGTCF
eukprot:9136508-Pyramimonas_sp.AAC.1